MTKSILFAFLVILTMSSRIPLGWAQASVPTQNLQSYVGKYPVDLLKSVPSLSAGMKALFGADYKFFMDRLEVQSPIANVQNHLIVRGCMAHSCSYDEAVLVIDLANGKLSGATLAKDTKEMPIKVYGDDKQTPSAALQSVLEEYHRDL